MSCYFDKSVRRIFVGAYYTVTDLGTLPGGATSNASDINDSGHVTGSSQVTGGNGHAFLWTPTPHLQDLGTLPGGSNSGGSGINAGDMVAGQSDLTGRAGNTPAFFWGSG